MKSKQKRLFTLIPISVFLCIIHFFIFRNHIQNIFIFPDVYTISFLLSISCSVLFCISIYYGICYIISELYLKNNTLLQFLKAWLPCFLILFCLLLFTWPGIFKGDEFYVLNAAKEFRFSSAQTGITSIIFISCLMFFPSLASITFFQICFISLIYGYFFYHLKKIYNTSTIYLLNIPLLLLPVLDGCLFNLRSTMVGWLFFFLLSNLYFSYKLNKVHLSNLFIISILSAILIAWRSEYIYLILFIPIACKILNRISYRKLILQIIVILLLSQLFQIPNKIALDGSNKYPISLVINPLGNIFASDDIKGEHAYDDVMKINETIDVALLRQQHSVRNISQYWNIPEILPKKQLNEFMFASVRLILNNQNIFWKCRFQTFAHTNGLYPDEINHPTAYTPNTIYTLKYYNDSFKDQYYFMEPLFGETVRNKLIDILACRSYQESSVKTTALYPIFYNCIPAILLFLICSILCIKKKKWQLLILSIITIVQLPLIFVTAPAMFFMYYYCLYMNAYFWSALIIFELTFDFKQAVPAQM